MFNPARNAAAVTSPTGSYAIGSLTFETTDMDRTFTYNEEGDGERRLFVEVWYPSDIETATSFGPYFEPTVQTLFSTFQDYVSPQEFGSFVDTLTTQNAANAPVSTRQSAFPVVLFSHGLGGVRGLYTSYIEELVSHGYIVAGIDHTYGAFATVFPTGETQLISFNPPEFPTIVQIWSEDHRHVLDVLTELNASSPVLAGKMDLDRVGVMGHSTGGSATALTLALDSRFDAGVTLDAPQVPDESVTQGVDDPILIVFAEPSEYTSTIVQNAIEVPGYVLTMSNTSHFSFTDLPLLLPAADVPADAAAQSTRPPGTIDPAVNESTQNQYIVQFFARHLLGEDAPLLSTNATPLPEASLQEVAPSAQPASTVAATPIQTPVLWSPR